MGVTNYDIGTPAFRREAAQDYELSILTGMDSFAYIIRDRNTNRLLAYRATALPQRPPTEWPQQLSELIAGDERLDGVRYGKVLVGWETAALTLIPEPLFDPGQLRSYLEQLTVVGLEDEVRYDTYPELDALLVYSGRGEVLEEAASQLRAGRLQHYAGGLLVAWAARARRLREDGISCCVRNGRLFIAGHDSRQRLLYFNTFSWENSQDAVYYLLLAYTQCDYAPGQVPLYLSGTITSTDELYYQFYRYVRDIRFSAYPAPPAVGPELEQLPAHHYFDLLCLS